MKLLVALTALALLAACSSSRSGSSDADTSGDTDGGNTNDVNDSVGLAPCDPLAGRPITLGTVFGVGADMTTLYVYSSNGVFVSSPSNTLVRQHVVGMGSSGTTEFLLTFEAPGADASQARNLLVELSGAVATAMALGPPNAKSFLNQSPAGTTPLTRMPTSVTTGMPVVNTPNIVSYLADVSNGDVLLATIPMNDDPSLPNRGLAIFYGAPASAIAQRPVTSFEQSLSGNGTLTFIGDDGVRYTLAFGNVSAPDAGPFSVFALQGLTPQGGSALETTLRSPTPTTLPTGLSFTCFSR